MPDAKRPLTLRYGMALLAVALAVALALLAKPGLSPGLAPEARSLLLFGAVLASAWYGGLGPGLLATLLAAALSGGLPPPLWSASGGGWPLALLVLNGISVSLLGAHLHAALRAGASEAPPNAKQRPAPARRLAADERPPPAAPPAGAANDALALPPELVSRLCHDMRSPLNTILGWAQLQRDGALDLASQERAWEAVARSARTQARLLDELFERTRAAEHRPAADQAQPPPGDISGLRLLVVDDEADMRALLRRLLARGGAEVRCCATAAEALVMLQQWQPDALISDLGMPGEDGYALIARIRALAPQRGGRVPALAVSGFGEAEAARRALAAGFQRFLPKPVAADRLLAAVAAIATRQSDSGNSRLAKAGGGGP